MLHFFVLNLSLPVFFNLFLEYCKTRALPTVKKSEYLNTLGKELHPDIDIMWTGDKVIPELITKDSIKELVEVLQRKPVIWDNIHANDYDQRRVFLGGYNGRPIELYPYLNGILTNPNCEFEANYVAIHTLGTWCRIASSVQESSSFDVQMVDLSDEVCVTPDTPIVPDVECEMPEDLLPSLTAADVSSVISVYDYNDALKLALQEWILEFNMNKKAPLKSYSKRNLKATTVNGQTVLTATPYELDIVDSTQETINRMKEDKIKCMLLTHDSLQLLTEMFCLPYEHGQNGNKLLEGFEWLLENAADIYEQPPSKEKVSRWFDRLLRCDERCKEVYDLFKNFCKIPNEAILYDLYPYLWDLKEVTSALDSYVHWLSDSITSNMSVEQIKRSHSGLNMAINKLPVLNEYIEPWHVKYLGGLTGALHRLLPFQGGYIYLGHAPDIPSNIVLKTRAFCPSDKDTLYRFNNRGAKNEVDVPMDPIEPMETYQYEVDYEFEVGVFASVCPKNLFLIEDEEKELYGYIVAVPDNKRFTEQVTEVWLPDFKSKYAEYKGDVNISCSMESEDWNLPNASHLILKLDAKVHQQCSFKRILNSVLSVLKTSGATTVYHRLVNDFDFDLLVELGFFPVSEVDSKLLWRSL